MGFSWTEILKYKDIITWISRKYSGDPDLAEDVAQEVISRLHEDKKLHTSNFDPTKKDAAIRQTIRNKVIKVLRSRNVGRWTMDSLDFLIEKGYQIDTDKIVARNEDFFKRIDHEHDDVGE